MVHLHRLIALLVFALVALPAFADGGPFPATGGGYNTSACNPSAYPQCGAGMCGVPATWTCKAIVNGQNCGWTDNSSGHFAGQCSTNKNPDTCPDGANMSQGSSG